ncbi:MAG: EAL domain-containing protein [Agarilytica sp.]
MTFILVLVSQLLIVFVCGFLISEYLSARKKLTKNSAKPHLRLGLVGVILCLLVNFIALIASVVAGGNQQSIVDLAIFELIGLSCSMLFILAAIALSLRHLNTQKPKKKPEEAPAAVNTSIFTAIGGGPFDSLFKDSPANYLVIDGQQNIIASNPAFAHFVESTTEALMQRNLQSIVEDADLDLLRLLYPEKIKTKKRGFEIQARLNLIDSEPLWVKISPRTIDLDDKRKGLLLLIEDIREAKNLAELITFHSQYDELTMLHNRAGLEKFLSKALSLSEESGGRVALIYLDIDQLKVVNDTCGHTAGDRLLQQIVAAIGQTCENRNFFARVGGDEFAVVKVNCSEEQAKNMAEQIRSAVEDITFAWEEKSFRQSVSLGVALSSDTLANVVDVIGAADSACYTAKKNGKNRVVMFAEAVESTTHSKELMWVSRLQKAIQSGAFELYFQPITRLDDDSEDHIHYEFLVRHVDENGNHVLPGEFIPAVERFGFSEQLDLWVLTTALDFLDKHEAHTEKLNCCSINLTSQSIANPRIRSAILQVVQSYMFPREKICFEITESSAIQNLNEAKEFLSELKHLGCKLAVDDFGTGFSSFNYLKELRVDFIKIDGSFVKDIETDQFDRAMVSSMNLLGKEMGVDIIAEYAETASVINLLKKMEVGYAQGNAIAKPMPLYSLENYYS